MGLVNAAACIGRVGGLAVALGIGAAMTSGIGVAWAEDSIATEQHAPAGTGAGPDGSNTQETAKDPADGVTTTDTKDEPSDTPAEAEAEAEAEDPEPAEPEQTEDPDPTPPAEPTDTPTATAVAEPEPTSSARPETSPATPVAAVTKKTVILEAAQPDTESAAPVVHTVTAVAVAAVVEPVTKTEAAAPTAAPAVAAKTLVTAAVTTEFVLPATLTAWFDFLVYTPLHALAQLWITSAIGREIDNIINWAAGSYVIGNGAAGTAENHTGGAGGWLLGDGGAGWNSTTDGIAGGAGGAGGMLGNGGLGGSGGAGAAGGAGGAGGWIMGIGGSGGDGGDGGSGPVGGKGGVGGAATSLVFGIGGSGGSGGDGADGGRGGNGGTGAQVLGSGGNGGAAGNSGVGAEATALSALGGAGGNAGSLGSHGKVGQSGTGGIAVDTVTPSGILAITPTGMTLTNSAGQVVILHGFNEVYKLAPYTPAAVGFSEDDAAFLAENGFNVMRVGIIWAGVEPEPGVFDTDYIGSIRDTVNMLAGYGIYSLIDMHQDLYSGVFGGEGAPDWATLTNGQTGAVGGFPWTYFTDPVQQFAWDSFWSNASGPDGVGLVEHYAKAWQHIASAFAGNNAVIGYDIMNEPFVGSGWLPALLGNPFFGDQQLAPMYDQVAAAIRSVDPATALIIEPPITDVPGLILGRQMNLGTMDDTNIIVAFHNYCSGEATASICGWISHQQADTAAAYGVAHNVPVMMNEFGASDQAYDLVPQMESADKYMMSWMEWNYSGVGDITTAGSPLPESLVFDPQLAPTGDNVNIGSLRILAGPYPQTISGTPIAFSNTGGTFTFSYNSEKVDGSGTFDAGSTTVISVPAVNYPNGYQVSVTGGHVVPTANTSLLVVASDSAIGTVTVVVTANAAL